MELLNKSKSELISLCKTYEIAGYSNKNKLQLIDLLNNNSDNNSDNNQNPIKHNKISKDIYTNDILTKQYLLHKEYVKGRIDTTHKMGIRVRLPSIPEDISENIIKFIIHNKLNDITSSWNCKTGDLYSENEGKQECKCFTSNGPLSFTPTSEWDIIYLLDAREWINDKFILYRIPLKRTSNNWKNIKVNKTQTFGEQCKQGRRPRITWEQLYPQISNYCMKVFEGNYNDIIIPVKAKE